MSTHKLWPHWQRGVLVGLLTVGLMFSVAGFGWLLPLERLGFDALQRVIATPGPATDQIRLILIDQASLEWGDRENGLGWPWPREVYAYIVTFCRRAEVASLTFDILYTEPSLYGVADDLAFAEALQDGPALALAAFFGEKSGSSLDWPAGFPHPLWPNLPADWPVRLMEPTRGLLPVADLLAGDIVLGNTHLQADADGVYRRVAPLIRFAGQTVPALGLAGYLAANPNAVTVAETGGLRLARHAVPLTADAELILRYRGPAGTFPGYSAAAILQSELLLRQGETPLVDPAEFTGRHVFVGMTAPGLYDLRPTPISASFPGVEVHATLLDNALSGDFIRPPSRHLDLALIICLAMLLSLLATRMSRPLIGLLLGAVVALTVLGGAVLGLVYGHWIPLVGPQITVWVVTVLSLTGNYAVEGRQKRFLKSAFRQYLSPVVVDQLLANPDQLRLGGESRTLTMFFSDLQGFTGFAERLAPETLTAFLNDYLSVMVDIIQEEGGTVDKFVGDAIVAFWNAPVAIADHAERAVRAALRCQESLAGMRPGQTAAVGDGLRMRVGLHTGPAVVGNMGSRSRFDYSMLGDAVNLASRLEGANREFGTWTLVSAATRQQVSDSRIRFRELGRLVVVGRQQAVTVYEALTLRDGPELQTCFERFEQGLAAYYAGDFERARQVFATISAIDPPARAYLKRLASLGPVAPAEWRGEWVLSGK